ncbi:MAG TPA: hypothetical protein VH300_01730 [Thermoleophilaceae bacterium]|nr:hypothetical protein [Thermoleophilaceae bacterium]
MKRLGVIVAALVALGAPLAYATTVGDRDDVATAFDIAKVSGAHNRATDQLVHTIDFYAAIPHRVAKSGAPDSVCIEIWTRSTPGESQPDYEACATRAKGSSWKGSIARKRERGPQLRLGAVKVEQPSDTRLVIRIDPDDIKRPAGYRWRTEATSFGTECKISSGCPDYAPDRPGTAETKLSKPRA